MKILFCCTGNTCRSPMAEQILRHKLNIAQIKGIEVNSCGAMCHTGDLMNEHAQAALKKLGITPTRHFSKPISKALLDDSDLIVCMTGAHRECLVNLLGENEKIKDINQLIGHGDVNDPFGGCQSSYDLCANIISENIDKLITTIILM